MTNKQRTHLREGRMEPSKSFLVGNLRRLLVFGFSVLVYLYKWLQSLLTIDFVCCRPSDTWTCIMQLSINNPEWEFQFNYNLSIGKTERRNDEEAFGWLLVVDTITGLHNDDEFIKIIYICIYIPLVLSHFWQFTSLALLMGVNWRQRLADWRTNKSWRISLYVLHHKANVLLIGEILLQPDFIATL